jgi:prephenate dehydrogenase
MRDIAIIGYGRFGKLAAFHLKKKATIFVFDKKVISSRQRGIEFVSLEEAASKKHIILSVPINQLERTIRKISPFLKPGSIVYDVCSVKEQPCKWMRKHLPKSVSIIGTHPLFGPDSAKDSLKQRNIALCPVRANRERIRKTDAFLRSLKLNVRLMKPDEHDRLMAQTLFLTQFICRGLNDFPLPETPFTTMNYRFLKQIIETTNNDSVELFKDMFRYNRFARTIPQEFLRDFQKLMRTLPK